jgi:hypothetical protein
VLIFGWHQSIHLVELFQKIFLRPKEEPSATPTDTNIRVVIFFFGVLLQFDLIPKPETESDESNTRILIENDHFSINNLSTSHSSLNNTDDHEPSISSEALRYANSLAFSFPPITIIGTPAFTSHSKPNIIHFLPSLVNAHSTVLRISEISWKLNNKNQLLLFAPSRDVFFILVTNT